MNNNGIYDYLLVKVTVLLKREFIFSCKILFCTNNMRRCNSFKRYMTRTVSKE